MGEKFKKYDQVHRDFSEFFSEQTLKQRLDWKADINLIDDLNELKCDKTEMDKTQNLIASLNDRLKHLSIL